MIGVRLFSSDQIESEEAVAFICNIGEKQLTGTDTETDYVMVDFDKSVGQIANTFSTRQIRVAVAVVTGTIETLTISVVFHFNGRKENVFVEENPFVFFFHIV